MAKEMTEDYKRNAINKALVEMYCSGEKYRNKNRELKERSKTQEVEWIKLKSEHQKQIEE